MGQREGFSCRQMTDNVSDEDWTEVLFGYGGDHQEAAEKFCKMFVLDGEAPYIVQSRDDRLGEVVEWLVERVMEPVFHARKRR